MLVFCVKDSTKQYATKAKYDCALIILCKSFYTQTTTLFHHTPTTTSPTIIRWLYYDGDICLHRVCMETSFFSSNHFFERSQDRGRLLPMREFFCEKSFLSIDFYSDLFQFKNMRVIFVIYLLLIMIISC